jgi:hypothetical protein
MITLQIAWIFARDPSIKVNGIIMVDSPFPDYRHVLPLAMGSPVSESGLGEARSKLELAMLRTADMLQKWRVPVWRREPQPYTVMLCARDYVNDDDNPALCLVDQFRESSTLGWNERARSLLVHESHSIEGHHFSIFEPRNVSFFVVFIPLQNKGRTEPRNLGRFCH